MRILRWLSLAIVSGLGATFCIQSAPQQKASTVTLRVLDSFGKPQSDCHLREFVLLDEGRGRDYLDHFTGTVGRDIPYGLTYRAHVKCADQRAGGTFLVSVGRSDEFLVLASWLNLGDYVTGPEARLTVAVRPTQETELTNGAWIKLVGAYVDRTEVDKINSESHTARFYHVVPGKYLMMLFIGDRVICTKQIEFVAASANLELTISGQSCNMASQTGVKLADQ